MPRIILQGWTAEGIEAAGLRAIVVEALFGAAVIELPPLARIAYTVTLDSGRHVSVPLSLPEERGAKVYETSAPKDGASSPEGGTS